MIATKNGKLTLYHNIQSFFYCHCVPIDFTSQTFSSSTMKSPFNQKSCVKEQGSSQQISAQLLSYVSDENIEQPVDAFPEPISQLAAWRSPIQKMTHSHRRIHIIMLIVSAVLVIAMVTVPIVLIVTHTPDNDLQDQDFSGEITDASFTYEMKAVYCEYQNTGFESAYFSADVLNMHGESVIQDWRYEYLGVQEQTSQVIIVWLLESNRSATKFLCDTGRLQHRKSFVKCLYIY
eukprot:TRINITY_DN1573_c1_g1_i1.p1 TRINITY_DN1573_c1_g1~~TRINITY_DN1573_c1_g1_i1.p1  ORF type:complete len:234 (+),score=-4.39 TRINITY_DN1573_c1_g1_i1:65-766(+)